MGVPGNSTNFGSPSMFHAGHYFGSLDFVRFLSFRRANAGWLKIPCARPGHHNPVG